MTLLTTPTEPAHCALAFRDLLTTALVQRVDAVRTAHAAAPERAFYFPYLLWAGTALRQCSGDDRWLEGVQSDLRAMLASLRRSPDEPGWLNKHFRFLAPVCAAFAKLEERGWLAGEDRATIATILCETMTARVGFMDYGAQNRGLIYGAEFLHAALLLPAASGAALWHKIGRALVYDSLHGWAQEDASGYEPFWLSYALEIAERTGVADAHLQRMTTRFYFDHTRELLMPDGLMPDWGDGDWTHSWPWNVANLARAGSAYRDGRYLDAARRHAEANLPLTDLDDPEPLGGLALALRWLDVTVPLIDSVLTESGDVVDDLVGKKYVFRGPDSTYLLYNYRDEKSCGHLTRDYQAKQLYAHEEKPHHGHADENSVVAFSDRGTLLLADGGYRDDFARGYRADFFHNRIVARTGFGQAKDPFDELYADTAYHRVTTEKLSSGNFGCLDYSRTRLIDSERGYTGDRIMLFAPATGLTVVVDSLVVDRAGPKQFFNLWHPHHVQSRGHNYIVSCIRDLVVRQPVPDELKEGQARLWRNPPGRALLIQFLGNRDKEPICREIRRRYAPSTVFGQRMYNYFFAGQRLTFVSVLRPHDEGSFKPEWLDEIDIVTNPHDDGRTLGLTMDLNGSVVQAGLKLDLNLGLTHLRGRPMFSAETGAVDYGDLLSDAEFSFVRTASDGTREIGAMTVGRMEHRGVTLFRMPRTHRMYQGPGDFQVDDCRDRMPRWHEIIALGDQPLHA